VILRPLRDPSINPSSGTREFNVVRRVIAAAALVVGLSVLWVGVASAHVHIVPDSTPRGSDLTAAFTVPNEESAANTTELQVQIPTDHPIGAVTVAPVPGWTINVIKSKLATPLKTDDGTVTEAVSEIDWTGGTIAPDQFQEFPISFDSLPDDVSSLTFKAVQTYSNGDVVRWIETDANGVEAEHPAPVLTLTKGSGDVTAAATPPKTSGSTVTTYHAVASSSDVSTAKTLGVVGIIVGALGLLVAAGALLRKPKAPLVPEA
jgi:uncharacterized protein YcnI